MTLAVVVDPADLGAGGRSESPSPTLTFPIGTPRVSAATWAAMVYVPVPRPWDAVETTTLPSGKTETRAEAEKRPA